MRTYVQIDVQNLFFAAKDIGKKIDFVKIRNELLSTGEDLVGLSAYIIRTPDANQERFERLLRALKYDLVIKTASIAQTSEGDRIYKNTDHDMAICIDCMKNIDNFDKWILMSGDGDFIDLCRHLKKHSKTIEVWAFPGKSFNKMFCNYADKIVFLTDRFFFDKPEEIS